MATSAFAQDADVEAEYVNLTDYEAMRLQVDALLDEVVEPFASAQAIEGRTVKELAFEYCALSRIVPTSTKWMALRIVLPDTGEVFYIDKDEFAVLKNAVARMRQKKSSPTMWICARNGQMVIRRGPDEDMLELYVGDRLFQVEAKRVEKVFEYARAGLAYKRYLY